MQAELLSSGQLRAEEIGGGLHTASSSPAAVSPLDTPCTLCHPWTLAFVLQDLPQIKSWKSLPWLTPISLSVLPLLHHALVCLCWKHHSWEKGTKGKACSSSHGACPSVEPGTEGTPGAARL